MASFLCFFAILLFINSYLNELTGVVNTSGSERDKELIEYLNNISIEFEKLKLKVEETYIAG
jgi:hypothetical protein